MDKLERVLLKVPATSPIPVDKGWSADRKYMAFSPTGETLLIRVAEGKYAEKKRREYAAVARVETLCIAAPHTRGFYEDDDAVAAVYTWINGQDAEDVVPQLPRREQYALGSEAGEILRKLHTLPPEPGYRPWAERFGAKAARKIAAYRACPLKFDGAEAMIAYIEQNLHLLGSRPQTFQHGDYHIGNMLCSHGKLSVIDFDRCDTGDPWEEFNRITWSAQRSAAFASGMVDGYFAPEKPPELFWRLLALYIASNQLSSLPWALTFGDDEVGTILAQCAEVMSWYDDYERLIPTWYGDETK